MLYSHQTHQNRVTGMDKKEKAMDFGIRLLDSLNYMLTLALIAILFVSGLFYYIHWKYGREQELNPTETATPVIVTPEPVSPSDSSRSRRGSFLANAPSGKEGLPYDNDGSLNALSCRYWHLQPVYSGRKEVTAGLLARAAITSILSKG